MRAERKLLVAQLSAARCSDSVTETPIAESFNTIVRRRDFPPDLVAPLTTADVWPAKVLGAARAERYWQTEDARRLLFGLLALRDSAAGRRSVIIKRSTEWQAAALQYLTDLELWNGSREPIERDYFDQKSLLYDVYLNVVLPGALRDARGPIVCRLPRPKRHRPPAARALVLERQAAPRTRRHRDVARHGAIGPLSLVDLRASRAAARQQSPRR